MTSQFDESVKSILGSLALGGAALASGYKHGELMSRGYKSPQQSIEQKIETSERPAKEDSVSKNTPIKARPYMSREAGTSQEKVRRSYQRLTSSGLSHNAAIGIIANLKAEAGEELRSDMVQKGGGPGRGIVQWEKGGRFDKDRINLVAFAKKKGKPWTDFTTQIDFIIHEMETHPEYKRVKQMLNNADSVEDATLIFLKKYEKAGIPHTEKRLKYAKELERTIR